MARNDTARSVEVVVSYLQRPPASGAEYPASAD